MIICIPVNNDAGLGSTVCSHFGQAPYMMMVETDTGVCTAVVNGHAHHGHGNCQPLAALEGQAVQAVVVGGIGMGALNKLKAAGLPVYLTAFGTVGETLDAFHGGSLSAMDMEGACAHHGGGRHHHHG